MSGERAKLDASAYLVLGMIRMGARSGYEIKRAVDSSLRFFWTISPAQIYPALALLTRVRLIEGKSEPTGKRRRQTFVITPAGKAALRKWLAQQAPIPFELRDLALVKLFFADALDLEDALALLNAVRKRSEARVAELRAIEPAAEARERKGDPFPLLTLQMGIVFHQAMLDACLQFEPRILAVSKRPAGTPGVDP